MFNAKCNRVFFPSSSPSFCAILSNQFWRDEDNITHDCSIADFIGSHTVTPMRNSVASTPMKCIVHTAYSWSLRDRSMVRLRRWQYIGVSALLRCRNADLWSSLKVTKDRHICAFGVWRQGEMINWDKSNHETKCALNSLLASCRFSLLMTKTTTTWVNGESISGFYFRFFFSLLFISVCESTVFTTKLVAVVGKWNIFYCIFFIKR